MCLDSVFPPGDPRWRLDEAEQNRFDENCKSPQGKLQRVFTRFALEANHPLRHHAVPIRAATLAKATRHSNTLLQQSPEVIDHASFPTFVPSETFVAVARVRLGCELTPGPVPCPLCLNNKGVVTADAHGEHVMSCMSLGHHAVASNDLRNSLGALVQQANFTVAYEAQCFNGENKRVDVYAKTASGSSAIDVFITHSCLGKVEEYAARKHTKYGPLTYKEPNTKLVAFG